MQREIDRALPGGEPQSEARIVLVSQTDEHFVDYFVERVYVGHPSCVQGCLGPFDEAKARRVFGVAVLQNWWAAKDEAAFQEV